MNGSTANAQQAKRFYRQMKAKADAEIAAAKADPSGEPPIIQRLRHSRDAQGRPVIDYSKAARGCTYCGGTGQRPPERVMEPPRELARKRLPDGTLVHLMQATGEELVIAVVCRCVKRNGGVAKDRLDLMAEKARQAQEQREGRDRITN